MSQIIADELGLELVVKAIEWDGLIPALLSGEIDLIIAGMSPTSEEHKLLSPKEYYRSEQVMVNPKEIQCNFIKDFNGELLLNLVPYNACCQTLAII